MFMNTVYVDLVMRQHHASPDDQKVHSRDRSRDKGAVDAAVFRPQTGYYNSIQEEAAALMESLGNNHGFLDGNKRIAFTATDVFLRRNGFYIEVEGLDGNAFIYGSMDRHEFRFAQILDWIRQHIKPLV
jgi:death-on-curing protein